MIRYQFHLHNFAFFSLPPKPRKGRKLKENSIFYTFSWCGRKGEREDGEFNGCLCAGTLKIHGNEFMEKTERTARRDD